MKRQKTGELEGANSVANSSKTFNKATQTESQPVDSETLDSQLQDSQPLYSQSLLGNCKLYVKSILERWAPSSVFIVRYPLVHYFKTLVRCLVVGCFLSKNPVSYC